MSSLDALHVRVRNGWNFLCMKRPISGTLHQLLNSAQYVDSAWSKAKFSGISTERSKQYEQHSTEMNAIKIPRYLHYSRIAIIYLNPRQARRWYHPQKY